jgi:hypothetical protein
MGRKATATRDAVFKAAANIEIQAGSPKAVTIEAIRKLIGGGSSSTIHHHLKKWRAGHTDDLSSPQNDENKEFTLPPTIKNFIAKMRSDIDTLERLLELEMSSSQRELDNFQAATSVPPSDTSKSVVKPKVSKKVSAPKKTAAQKIKDQPKSTHFLKTKDGVTQEEPDIIENSEQSEVNEHKPGIANIKDGKNKAQLKKKNMKEENSIQGDLFS